MTLISSTRARRMSIHYLKGAFRPVHSHSAASWRAGAPFPHTHVRSWRLRGGGAPFLPPRVFFFFFFAPLLSSSIFRFAFSFFLAIRFPSAAHIPLVPVFFPCLPRPDLPDHEAHALVVGRVEPEDPVEDALGFLETTQTPQTKTVLGQGAQKRAGVNRGPT